MCVCVCFCVSRGVDKFDHTQGHPLLCRENAFGYVIYLPSSAITSLSTTTTPPRLACFPFIFERVKNVPSWSSAQIYPSSRMVLPTPALGSFLVFSSYAMSVLLLQRRLPWPLPVLTQYWSSTQGHSNAPCSLAPAGLTATKDYLHFSRVCIVL